MKGRGLTEVHSRDSCKAVADGSCLVVVVGDGLGKFGPAGQESMNEH